MKIKIFLTSILLTTCITLGTAQLIVNYSTYSEAQLLEIILGGGIDANTLTFTGDIRQRGYFNASNANLGLDEGVVLSTGNIFVGVGPNDSDNATLPSDSGCGVPEGASGPGGLCRPGDNDLNDILSGSTLTYDAAVIEVEFSPMFNTLLLNYVFASEEYPEYACSEFNDVFAFFLSGPRPGGGDYNKANIAMIPNTDLPVAINTINPGVPGESGTTFGCIGSDGSLNYSHLYVSNTLGASVQFDGFTIPLQMVAPVVAGETYLIKIAIADAADGVLDSAVFLKGDSFQSIQLTDIEESEDVNRFNIQPNPSTGRFIIDAGLETAQTTTIQIVDVLGQEIYHSKNTKKDFMEEIDISNEPIGTYFVIIQTENGKAVQKIAISR